MSPVIRAIQRNESDDLRLKSKTIVLSVILLNSGKMVITSTMAIASDSKVTKIDSLRY